MRRLTGFAAILLMLVMMLPVLACAATANAARMDSDCCRQMRGMCGDMAKQGCCHVEDRTDLPQLPARVMADAVLPATTVPIVYVPMVEPPASSGYTGQAPRGHSPPGLVIASTIVLRI